MMVVGGAGRSFGLQGGVRVEAWFFGDYAEIGYLLGEAFQCLILIGREQGLGLWFNESCYLEVICEIILILGFHWL